MTPASSAHAPIPAPAAPAAQALPRTPHVRLPGLWPSRLLTFALTSLSSLLIPALALAQGLPLPGSGAGSAAAGSPVVSTEHVRTELIAHAPEGVAPGQVIWAGLRIEHAEHWHTYWKNPGEAGLPTELQWTLPPGIEAGDVRWPLPQTLKVGPIVNYGYEGTVLLAVPLKVSPAFRPQPLAREITLSLHASWLVCKTECVPEEGQYTLRIPLQGSTARHGADFEAAQQAALRALPPSHQVRLSVHGQALAASVEGLPADWQGRTLQVFPEQAEVLDPPGQITQKWQGPVWTAELPLYAQRSTQPARLALVLASGAQGWRVEAPVHGRWPAAQTLEVPAALKAALQANQAPAQAQSPTQSPGQDRATEPTPAPTPGVSYWLALAGALLGGLILNLMPCVFPVLAIKVLGIARHADDARSHRLSGLAYTAGVLLSFAALGLALLALRSAGQNLGWGFQLQSPLVIAALAALFVLVALNLAGVFEFGQFLPSGLASFQARNPVLDALLTGVLAVAVASPCTAPFMGASLGLAITLPGPQALAIFLAIGLGLALPYLLASFVPAVARWLPRPGPWMDTLRRIFVFPMLLTVAWLVWVLGQQSGVNGAGALLVLLVAGSAVVWSATLAGRARLLLLPLSGALALWALWTLGPLLTEDTGAPTPTSAQASSRWQPWSPARQQALLAAGQPVFVDYTAAWCVTCQVNERTTLADPRVQADFSSRNVALLRADWTRRDPVISNALSALGRNGVPVYVIQRPGHAPQVLSELISVAEVQAALAPP